MFSCESYNNSHWKSRDENDSSKLSQDLENTIAQITCVCSKLGTSLALSNLITTSNTSKNTFWGSTFQTCTSMSWLLPNNQIRDHATCANFLVWKQLLQSTEWVYRYAYRILRKNLDRCFAIIFGQLKLFRLIDLIPGFTSYRAPGIKAINWNNFYCSKIITKHWSRFFFSKFGTFIW